MTDEEFLEAYENRLALQALNPYMDMDRISAQLTNIQILRELRKANEVLQGIAAGNLLGPSSSGG